jgi:hypothetical protein
MISGAPPRVGTLRRPNYTPSCCTETMAVPPPTTPRRGTWGGSWAAAVRRHRDGWATRGVCLCARRQRVRSTTRLGAFGVNPAASGLGARRSAVRRHRRRVRCGKTMASNFCVL